MMDLSAALDTVDHNALLDLLQKMFGPRETVLKWCRDYLSNRSFKVCVEGEYSDCVVLCKAVVGMLPSYFIRSRGSICVN